LSLLAIGTALLGIASSIVRKAWTNQLPGALVGLGVYSMLAVAIWRGHAWARWTLFALIILSGVLCFVFAIEKQTSVLAVDYKLLLVGLVYIAVAVVIGWPVRRPTQ
jgi:hypothetical protein